MAEVFSADLLSAINEGNNTNFQCLEEALGINDDFSDDDFYGEEF